MSTLAGLLKHRPEAGQAPSRNAASPMAGAASGAGGANGANGAGTNSATVSANDFLTLLVTEMKNQDPTANTDPNEYINQLVNVNSLEQLIDIDQTLNTALGSSPSTSKTGVSPRVATNASIASDSASPATGTQTPHAMSLSKATSAASTSQASATDGNLSGSQPTPAAIRVGHALAPHMRAFPARGTLLANQ